MFIGRTAEIDALVELCNRPREGGGGVLLVLGEQGSGKTALLDQVVLHAAPDALRASGFGAARGVAYATLASLLGPLDDRLPTLPSPRREVLASALSLGPPSPGDRFGVCVAALELLADVATGGSGGTTIVEPDPVIIVVDDLQLVDEDSRLCLALIARQVERLPVVVLASADHMIDGWADVPTLRLGAMRREDARALVPALLGHGVPREVEEQLLDAADGNPLILTELAASIGETRGSGSGPRSLDLPTPLRRDPRSLQRARLESVPPRLAALLELAAFATSDAVGFLTAACTSIGLDAEVIDEAVDAELLRVATGRFAFVHPIMREVVQATVDEPSRRRLHRVLADAATGAARVWHRAEASAAADEEIANELQATALGLQARRGYADAAIWFERAAWASVDLDARAGRLLAAGIAAAGAGQAGPASTLLTQARDEAPGAFTRMLAAHLLGLVTLWNGNTVRAQSQLVRAAESARATDPARAAHMLADAALANTAIGDCHRALELAEEAQQIGGTGPVSTKAVVGTALAWSLALRGRGKEAKSVLEDTEPLAAMVPTLDPAAPSLALGMNVRVFGDDYQRARDDALAAVIEAEESGALASKPFSLGVACEALLRLGEWDGLEARYDDAIRLAELLRQDPPLAFLLVSRSRLDALCGRQVACVAGVERAMHLAEGLGMGSIDGFGLAARAISDLGHQRHEDALGWLERLEILVRRQGMRNPTLVPWLADVVEVNVRLGRRDGARRAASELAEQAETAGSVVAAAMSARCQGLVATTDYAEHFDRARVLHDERPMPFERARTDLVFGERLRRDRQRAAARTHLQAAAAVFDRLGAEPWSARTHAELDATSTGLPGDTGSPMLTPQQDRIALAVARGARNREIAEELFVSQKTVEFHLRRIYRQLGIRSRTELTAWVLRDGPAGAGSKP